MEDSAIDMELGLRHKVQGTRKENQGTRRKEARQG
jgi:hypothetical protein